MSGLRVKLEHARSERLGERWLEAKAAGRPTDEIHRAMVQAMKARKRAERKLRERQRKLRKKAKKMP